MILKARRFRDAGGNCKREQSLRTSREVTAVNSRSSPSYRGTQKQSIPIAISPRESERSQAEGRAPTAEIRDFFRGNCVIAIARRVKFSLDTGTRISYNDDNI